MLRNIGFRWEYIYYYDGIVDICFFYFKVVILKGKFFFGFELVCYFFNLIGFLIIIIFI